MNNLTDPKLIETIVCEVKSQGLFDQFRKECLFDVDTKPAYQNLQKRVENSVSTFLDKQEWRSDLNKNQLREKLRKNITDSSYFETGVERIVDQVVIPKISSVFLPKIEDVVYSYFGIEKPIKPEQDATAVGLPLEIKTDLLPTDLEAVSPDSSKSEEVKSVHQSSVAFVDRESGEEEDVEIEEKIEDFESPPFEPLESIEPEIKKEESNDSQLSDISGLTSQDSVSSNKEPEQIKSEPVENEICQRSSDHHQSQLSQVSSNSQLSILTTAEEDNFSRRDIAEEAQMPEFNEKAEDNSDNKVEKKPLSFDINRDQIAFKGTDRNAEVVGDADTIKWESSVDSSEHNYESKTDDDSPDNKKDNHNLTEVKTDEINEIKVEKNAELPIVKETVESSAIKVENTDEDIVVDNPIEAPNEQQEQISTTVKEESSVEVKIDEIVGNNSPKSEVKCCEPEVEEQQIMTDVEKVENVSNNIKSEQETIEVTSTSPERTNTEEANVILPPEILLKPIPQSMDTQIIPETNDAIEESLNVELETSEKDQLDSKKAAQEGASIGKTVENDTEVGKTFENAAELEDALEASKTLVEMSQNIQETCQLGHAMVNIDVESKQESEQEAGGALAEEPNTCNVIVPEIKAEVEREVEMVLEKHEPEQPSNEPTAPAVVEKQSKTVENAKEMEVKTEPCTTIEMEATKFEASVDQKVVIQTEIENNFEEKHSAVVNTVIVYSPKTFDDQEDPDTNLSDQNPLIIDESSVEMKDENPSASSPSPPPPEHISTKTMSAKETPKEGKECNVKADLPLDDIKPKPESENKCLKSDGHKSHLDREKSSDKSKHRNLSSSSHYKSSRESNSSNSGHKKRRSRESSSSSHHKDHRTERTENTNSNSSNASANSKDTTKHSSSHSSSKSHHHSKSSRDHNRGRSDRSKCSRSDELKSKERSSQEKERDRDKDRDRDRDYSSRDKHRKRKSEETSTKKESKPLSDDHASSREKRPEKRRSNDRDSNDGSSCSSKNIRSGDSLKSTGTSKETTKPADGASSPTKSSAPMNITSSQAKCCNVPSVLPNDASSKPPESIPRSVNLPNTPVVIDQMLTGKDNINLEYILGQCNRDDPAMKSLEESLKNIKAIRKPKIATNIHEARKMMKIRKRIEREEKKRIEKAYVIAKQYMSVHSNKVQPEFGPNSQGVEFEFACSSSQPTFVDNSRKTNATVTIPHTDIDAEEMDCYYLPETNNLIPNNIDLLASGGKSVQLIDCDRDVESAFSKLDVDGNVYRIANNAWQLIGTTQHKSLARQSFSPTVARIENRHTLLNVPHKKLTGLDHQNSSNVNNYEHSKCPSVECNSKRKIEDGFNNNTDLVSSKKSKSDHECAVGVTGFVGGSGGVVHSKEIKLAKSRKNDLGKPSHSTTAAGVSPQTIATTTATTAVTVAAATPPTIETDKKTLDDRKIQQAINFKANQRYSSDDLYKPRPIVGQRSRRRGERDELHDKAMH